MIAIAPTPVAGRAVSDDPELPIEVEAYLTHLVVERGRSPRTIAAYRGDLRRYVAYLDRVGSELTRAGAADLDGFRGSLEAEGLATSSVIRMVGSVRALYRFLSIEGLVAEDPGATLEVPRRPQPVPRALSEAQVTAMLDVVAAAAAGGDPVALRDLALVELLYATGARVSEACGIGFGDLDLEAALVRLYGKRAKERIVPMGRPAVRALATWLEDGRPALVAGSGGRGDADAVFLGVRGRRLGRQAAWEVIRRTAVAAGLSADVSPHVLRHSCATHLIDHGADIRTVAELLGHASVSTTQIYTRVATDRLFEVWRDAHPRARRTAP